MIQSCFQLIIVCNLFKCCVFFLDLSLSRQTLFWVRVDPRQKCTDIHDYGRGMDSSRALKMCGGIWHRCVSSRSSKSSEL